MALTRSEEAKIIRARVRQRLAADNCETIELGACGRMMTRKRSNGLQSATKEEALGEELLFGEIASRDAQNGSAPSEFGPDRSITLAQGKPPSS
jgi:hypothetical protein